MWNVVLYRGACRTRKTCGWNGAHITWRVPFNSGLYCKMTCQVLWRHFWLDWRWHVCRQDSAESPLGIYHFNGHLKALLVEMYAVTWSLSGWKSPVCCFYCHGECASTRITRLSLRATTTERRTAIQKGLLSSLLFPLLKLDVLLWCFLDRIAYVWRFFLSCVWEKDMSFYFKLLHIFTHT